MRDEVVTFDWPFAHGAGSKYFGVQVLPSLVDTYTLGLQLSARAIARHHELSSVPTSLGRFWMRPATIVACCVDDGRLIASALPRTPASNFCHNNPPVDATRDGSADLKMPPGSTGIDGSSKPML